MKKGSTIALAIGALALGALAGVAGQRAYDASRFSTPADTSSGGGSSGQGSSSQSNDGSIAAEIRGGPKFAANVGATKTVVFTITPSTASDPYVIVATAAPTKVTVSATRVKSGAAVTLTLASIFNGTVAITAHPEALPASVVTVNVSVYNFVTTLNFGEYGVSDKAAPASDADAIDVFESDEPDEYFSGKSSIVSRNASDQLSYTLGASDGYYLYATMNAYGRDTTIMPDISTVPSGYFKLSTNTTSHCIEYAKLIASTGVSAAATLTWAIENATLIRTAIAYTAPASLAADNTSVQYS